MAFSAWIRVRKIALVAAVWIWSLHALLGVAQSSDKARVPVLVELFTSEGCSDCPPADALLARLDAKQPIAGVEAIVLSEHVTYWDHLGWRDPFSLDIATQRQEEYVRRFGLNSAYTPQAVVDGASQFVGSDEHAMVAAVSKAAMMPKMNLEIENARWDHCVVRFAVRGEASKGLKLVVVLAANATHSEVARGENAGRVLHHTAVVRAMKEMDGVVADGRALSMEAQTGSIEGQMRLVVFATDVKTGRVIAAAEQALR
ncbi:DUF1223 domain-containing protein [Occallatibacter savannae]|uniref:DUF1223 domain-containing protein n=1 Tax=Occallatibacter savannae TaxID=1002691 RepID=UPI000D686704|nr:DUF1223 domain-containing protein [Occallatibacter savannae]